MADSKTGSTLDEEELRVMALLVIGLTDEAAAARLGWTHRTFRRRLKSAMEKLGARSRMQAGFLLGRSGGLADLDEVIASV